MFRALAPKIALARRVALDPVDYARTVIVSACALALILAGQALPV